MNKFNVDDFTVERGTDMFTLQPAPIITKCEVKPDNIKKAKNQNPDIVWGRTVPQTRAGSSFWVFAASSAFQILSLYRFHCFLETFF